MTHLDAKYFVEILDRLLRVPFVEGTHTTRRVIDTQDVSGYPLWIDQFGAVLLAHVTDERCMQLLRASSRSVEFSQLLSSHAISSFLFRQHRRHADETAQVAAQLLFGALPEIPFQVEEWGVRYLVDPVHQVNAGFFTDMQQVRKNLLDSAHQGRVLNLFCFTGTLGVAALAGGAREVVQVDISKSALTWARQNAECNRPFVGTYKLIPEDARVYLRRTAARVARGAEPFSWILIDPPSFGSGDGKPFRLVDELPGLIGFALDALGPQGNVLVSCNDRAIDGETLAAMVRDVVSAKRRSIVKLAPIPLPPGIDNHAADSIASRGVVVCIQ